MNVSIEIQHEHDINAMQRCAVVLSQFFINTNELASILS